MEDMEDANNMVDVELRKLGKGGSGDGRAYSKYNTATYR
jgi:hypothetical protein